MARKKVVGPDTLDIRRAAYSMFENHGRQAAEAATKRARNLDGASEARLVWECIAAALTDMQAQSRGALA